MAGIYIHIPFCKKKCSYCDFHFSTNFESYESRMIEALGKELELRKEELQNEIIETIYFGGGTPSIVGSEDLSSFLDLIAKNYKLAQELEITLEANPDDISIQNIKDWKAIGINRLSIGVQSFQDSDLQWMNRAHNAKESIESIKIAQENGINNISIDLIYGLPNMNAQVWKEQLSKAIALNVQHISAYCLTVEEKTALHHLVKTNKIQPASNEMQAEHFEVLVETLKSADFIQYEISNFGKINYFSKHNSAYWKGKKYLGIGPSAHSFNGKSRSWNISNNTLYMKGIEQNVFPCEQEELTSNDIFNELLLTGLRTIWGVSLSRLNEIKPLTENFSQKMNYLLAQHQAEIKNQHLILTNKGMLLADSIAADLFC